MLEYATKYFTRYVNEKDLKKAVTLENPVPNNFLTVPRLDSYYYELLEDRRRSHEMGKDSTYRKIQEKLRTSMGPLSKLWYIVEEMVANPEKPVSKEDRGELIQLAEQTVMLTGQTFNLITHNRRMNVLTAVGQENKKAKENLKDHVSESLQKSGKELFGEDFRKILKEKAKAKKD